jgi:uncharacterized protein (DUF58 family)
VTPAARQNSGRRASLATWLQRWSWRNLRIASGLQEYLRRRFTPAGQTLLAGTLAAGLFGLDTRITAAHQAFALGGALLLVAAAGTRRPASSLQARRRLPRHATVGQPCRYRLRVVNAGRRSARDLDICERLPDPRPDLASFLASRAPVEAGVNPVERLFGYARWEWLVRRARRAEPQRPVPLADIPPGGSIELQMTMTPLRRGWLRLDALIAARSDVLGLMRRETPVDGGDRVLVLPRRYPLRPLPPPGRRRLQPGGVSRASTVGESQEFIGLRDYLPGDSPRHIHWAAWARCGEPVVKEYQDEYFSRQALVLDSFIGDDGAREAAFECAVSVAASLVEPLTATAGAQDRLLDLIFVADHAHAITGGRGVLSTDVLLELLACLVPKRCEDFSPLSQTVIAQTAQLSACLCVLLTWDPPRQALVARMRAFGVPVTVLLLQQRTDAALGPDPMTNGARLLLVDPADPAPALASL